MNAKVGTFTAPSSTTGNQAVTGVGFTPKALLLWTTYQTASGYTDGCYFGIGWTDGAAFAYTAMESDDNSSPNDTNRTTTTTSLVAIQNLSGSSVRVGAFVSFDADGFTINWTTADAVAPIFHYMAIGGSDLTAQAQDFTDFGANPSTSAITRTPAALFCSYITGSGDFGNGPGMGWAAIGNHVVTQGAIALAVRDNLTTQDTWRYQQANRCCALLTNASGAVFEELAFNGMGLSAPTNATGSNAIALLALSGIAAKAGALNQPTSTGTQAVSGLGFQPKVVLLMSVGNTTQTGSQAQARLSFGAGDGSAQGRAWIGSEDAVNPSRAAKGHSTSVALSAVSTVNATGASNAADAECAIQSLDADGFTLNWTAADATVREVLWLALGDATSAGGGAHAYGFAA